MLKLIEKKNHLISLVGLILIANSYTLQTHLTYAKHEDGTWVSLLELLSPASTAWLSQPSVFLFLKFSFSVLSIFWIALSLRRNEPRRTLGVLAICVTVLYLLISSIFWENLPWFRHKYVLPFWFLLFFSLQYFERSEESPDKRSNWPILYGFLIWGSFYSLSAINKIWHSAETWFSGHGLALWTHAFANPTFVPTDQLAFFQFTSIFTLLIEFLAFPMMLIAPRSLLALLCFFLTVFHLVVLIQFGIPFIGHSVLSALLIFHALQADVPRWSTIFPASKG